MERLLHSKIFRKNLFSWLFMYICIILLFTCVITYSRYISSMANNDSARTAKFDVEFNQNENDGKICSVTSGLCNLSQFRPSDKLEYKFSIDTTNVEVSTLLVASVSVGEYFDIVSIDDGTTVTDFPTNEEKTLTDGTKLTYTTMVDNSQVINLQGNVGPNKNNDRRYKLILKFKNENYNYKQAYELLNSIKINYSATQID